MTTTLTPRKTTPEQAVKRNRIFGSLIGLSALAVLLQGLWAGIFLQHSSHPSGPAFWVDVHARGAEVALFFAAAATVYAFWKRRARKDLWIGGAVLTGLIVAESYLGGLIRDDGNVTLIAVHAPLALAIMAVAVWLSVRARVRIS